MATVPTLSRDAPARAHPGAKRYCARAQMLPGGLLAGRCAQRAGTSLDHTTLVAAIASITATNGTLHIIDTVLLPPAVE